MGGLEGLASGFAIALTATNILWAFIGCLLGTAVGVLPGVGPAVTIALLLPLTTQLEPTSALIMFCGVYYGAMYGGSTTSILLNTPGESASIATSLEGNAMAKRGRAGAALATAAIGSFVAGTIATVLVTLVAPPVAEWGLSFGPAEKFSLILLAFMTISAVLGTSALRGFASLFLGLFIGLIGTDALSGQIRFAMGIQELYDGIDVVVVAVGLFAIGETLYVASHERRVVETVERIKGSLWMSSADFRRSIGPWLRGTAIGFPFGTMPAGGAEIPTFLSYATEKRLNKGPDKFGEGAIEGVAGPEAANNASVTAALIPLLTLGLPTSATAAIILTGFQQYGIQPGPLLFTTQADLVWALIASLYLGNVMLLVLNLPMAGVWARLLTIPRPMLYAGIVVFATISAYGMRNSWFDLFLLAFFGLVGYVMKRFDVPVAPCLVGMILGPRADTELRRALQISQSDFSVFLTRPISAALLAVAVALVVVPAAMRWRDRRRARAQVTLG
ncbi:MAG TPA: tripartite tricarboxylate transporter permease [Casimicrobiaceae bacterium]|nr:tripartite tricarboxylate transporter permease [Casimicrobiaceae bacterium]